MNRISCLLLVGIAAASAAATIEFTSPFIAEGVAYSETTKLFYGGNIMSPILTSLTMEGVATSEPLTALPDGWGTVGIYYSDGFIYGATGSYLPGFTGQPLDPNCGVVIYDETAKTSKHHDLSDVATGGKFCNDLVVLPDGSIYVTEMTSGSLFKVDAAGTKSVFLTGFDGWEPITVSSGLTLSVNGIEQFTGKDGKQYLIVAQAGKPKSLWRVDVATKDVVEISVADTEFASNTGIDGIRFVDGHLAAVMSTASGTVHRRFTSDDDWVTASISGKGVDIPIEGYGFTTLAKKDNKAYGISIVFAPNSQAYISEVSFAAVDAANCGKWSAWCNTGNTYMDQNCVNTCGATVARDSCARWSAFCGKGNAWVDKHCEGTCSGLDEVAAMKKELAELKQKYAEMEAKCTPE